MAESVGGVDRGDVAEAGRTRYGKAEIAFALGVVALGLFIGAGLHGRLWTVDGNGFSVISGKLPYWDFSNLWAGSRMALDGNVGWLFDVEAYRSGLRAMFSPHLPDQEWSYPPSILLLGVPLAMMPIFWAYVAWTAGTIAALYLSLRLLDFPPIVRLLIALSPAVMLSALFGQNGALTAALLLSALALSGERPLLAGLLAGLLTIKPHLGILIPFAFLAAGNWRAFLSAAVTASVMVMLTAALFGADIWSLFMARTGPLMAAILEAPYPQHYHANAMTFFILGRWLGLTVVASYALQAVFTILAIAATLWLWRPENAVSLQARVVMTALLTISATPYGYSYDAVPLAVAVAWLFAAGPSWPVRILLGGLWVFPFFAHLPNFHGYGVTVLVPALLALYGLRKIRPRITAS